VFAGNFKHFQLEAFQSLPKLPIRNAESYQQTPILIHVLTAALPTAGGNGAQA